MDSRARQIVLLLAGALAALLAPVPPAGGTAGSAGDGQWVLSLPDSAALPGPAVRLGDLADAPLPPAAAAIVLLGEGRPGEHAVVDRRTVLRKLVESGLSAGLERCAGAPACRVSFTGRGAKDADVRARLAELLAPLVPPSGPGAPAAWIEFDVSVPVFGPEWTLELLEPRPLRPGRNLVRLRMSGVGRAARFTASVLCHAFGETARPRGAIAEGAALTPEHFLWEWQDLATGGSGLVTSRDELAGRCAGRPLAGGAPLRQGDLRPIPLVRGGEPVDLAFRRGSVTVTVRGIARQDGALGETVTVRSEVTGQLVAGRVSGPGLVEGRR